MAVDFDEVYERFRRPVWRLAKRMTENEEEALDTTQEVFLRVWRGLPGFRVRLEQAREQQDGAGNRLMAISFPLHGTTQDQLGIRTAGDQVDTLAGLLRFFDQRGESTGTDLDQAAANLGQHVTG